ncbi:MAG: choice-of-anchor Q domain-containing protein, partial [Gammaproteobacteria bacterium]
TPSFGLCPDVGGAGLGCPGGNDVVYDDLAVVGTDPMGLAPRFSIFSMDYAGPGSGNATNNLLANVGFVSDYVNGDRGQTIQMPEVNSSIEAQPAFDEGGNFIDVRFGPLSLNVDLDGNDGGIQKPDYHIGGGSAAIDDGTTLGVSAVQSDFDGQERDTDFDIGADEFVTP